MSDELNAVKQRLDAANVQLAQQSAELELPVWVRVSRQLLWFIVITVVIGFGLSILRDVVAKLLTLLN